MDKLAEYNRERWNALVEAGILYSRPKLEMDEATARQMIDEEGLLGDVAGKRVLLLAGGGGQQSAAFGFLGAQVTVLDLSDGQLEKDRLVAAHYGYDLDIQQGDMRDLSRFRDASFDIVWQPYAINYVPDVRPVFAEAARVLRGRGWYTVTWHNPFTQTVDDTQWHPEHGYPLKWPYVDGEIDPAIFGTANWTVETESGEQVEVEGPRMFRHTMRTFLNSLVDNGFHIRRFSEHRTWDENPEPGTWEHYKSVSPPYLTVWTVKE
ncbi:MAG: class I SAM-dependent methyltransferase [Caldilineaceae bacterium]|nr:class I SAM-dependent methyltransferase [Caldilineaceae bacterium]